MPSSITNHLISY